MNQATPWLLACLIVAVLASLVVWAARATETGRARECDAMGRTMLADKPYQCAPIKAEVTR